MNQERLLLSTVGIGFVDVIRILLTALLACLLFRPIGIMAGDSLTMPGVDAELLKPFKPLIQAIGEDVAAGSTVDWGNRVLFARGKGLQQGGGGQSVLMAKAAAKDFALRNAVALAGGIEIGIDGRMKNYLRGRLYISAMVKGAEVDRYHSVVEDGRTYWIAEIRLPLVGIKSLSVESYDLARKSHRRVSRGLRRLHPDSATFDAPPDNAVLLVDARDTGLLPSLYPILVGAGDEIVLDIDSLPRKRIIENGLCSFVTTNLSADELERGPALASLMPLHAPWRARDLIEEQYWLGADLLPRRILVSGSKAVGPQRSFLRLSDAATTRLKRDHRAASLLYGGKVMVIVDAPSTGQDGYLTGNTRVVRSSSTP